MKKLIFLLLLVLLAGCGGKNMASKLPAKPITGNKDTNLSEIITGSNVDQNTKEALKLIDNLLKE